MKKLVASTLALLLPVVLCIPATAAQIPDGYAFQVEIVGSYVPEHKPDTETKEQPEFDDTLESFAQAFTNETNRIRAEHGLPEFEADALLTEMAQQRIEESDHMDHRRPDGSDPTGIFEEYGSELRCTGENLMAAGPSPENAARGFMSTSHRENILNPEAEYMGVGVKWVDTAVGPRISVLQLFAMD
ncbi:MAG: hypothetical protein HFG20_00880 [Anaerotruncus sp.]|nr:hypothetical protein [Anaerotruncus sp.]